MGSQCQCSAISHGWMESEKGQEGPGCAHIAQHQLNVGALLMLSGMKPGHEEDVVQYSVRL